MPFPKVLPASEPEKQHTDGGQYRGGRVDITRVLTEGDFENIPFIKEMLECIGDLFKKTGQRLTWHALNRLDEIKKYYKRDDQGAFHATAAFSLSSSSRPVASSSGARARLSSDPVEMYRDSLDEIRARSFPLSGHARGDATPQLAFKDTLRQCLDGRFPYTHAVIKYTGEQLKRLPPSSSNSFLGLTVFEVVNGDTLNIAQALVEQGENPLVLDMAN